MRRSYVAMMLAFGIVLSGCGVKPPDCAAEPTVAAIRDLFRDGVQATLDQEVAKLQQPHERERFQQLARGFLNDLKVSVSEVVSNGYDAKAKRYSCAGKVGVESPTAADGGYSVRSDYSTQATEDDKGKFLVRVEEYQPLLRAVISQGFAQYVSVKVKADAVANPQQQAEFEKKGREVEEARSGMPASEAEYVMGVNVLRFARAGQESLNFEYVSDAPAGTCSLRGSARVLGSSAHFSEGPEIGACSVNFQFSSGGRLDVGTTGNCITKCPPDQHKLEGTYGKRQG